MTSPVVLMVGSDICDCGISWSYLLAVVFSTLLARKREIEICFNYRAIETVNTCTRVVCFVHNTIFY